MVDSWTPDRARAHYAAIADGLSSRLEAVPSDGWAAPSPCPDWTARGVIEHVIDVHRWIVGLLGGVRPPALGPDADPAQVWPVAQQAVLNALADPARARQIVASPFGEKAFPEVVGTLLANDTLVHTWDLARATGQDECLDPRALRACFDNLRPKDAMLRRPGVFDAKLDPPPGADEQTEFLAFLGRRAW